VLVRTSVATLLATVSARWQESHVQMPPLAIWLTLSVPFELETGPAVRTTSELPLKVWHEKPSENSSFRRGANVYPVCDRAATATSQAHGHGCPGVDLRADDSDVDRLSVRPPRSRTRSDVALAYPTIGVGSPGDIPHCVADDQSDPAVDQTKPSAFARSASTICATRNVDSGVRIEAHFSTC
jgi:hypothetical protein